MPAKMASFLGLAFIAPLMLPLIHASQEYINRVDIHASNIESNDKQMNTKLMSEIRIHGILLWSSIGFLMPIGILSMRMAKIEELKSKVSVSVLFRAHQVLQIVSVLLTTVAAVMSFKNFNNSFSNSHQRIGVLLYTLIWVQAIFGFARPERGARGRGMWFITHWVIGTAVSLLGVITIYTGLLAYTEKTSRSTRIWPVLFTAEICCIVIIYLLQDKWGYIQKQGEILRDEPLPLTDPAVLQRGNRRISNSSSVQK